MAYAEKSPHRPSFWFKNDQDDFEDLQLQLQQQQQQQTLPLPSAVVTPPPPSFAGIPLKYISLLTLAIQNAALAVLMHYSRVSAQPSHTYSAASAVLATELLKGAISLAIAFTRIDVPPWRSPEDTSLFCRSAFYPPNFFARCRLLGKEVFRPDCWKLSIPAILYVIQNNLQFVAASNLDAATFQVSYQMKILTTAAFSVVLLRKKLTPLKWFSLFFLAVGVGVVQLQTSSRSHSGDASYALAPLKGFLAVAAACFTSGLAGVYFEMVLKNSSGDLWVRNVQLSLFSLLPALAPIVFSGQRSSGAVPSFTSLFANFTVAAWATVGTQVLGGLITALVIKYADNIMKGFATSLSIVISFLLSVAIFHVQITLAFLVGAAIVLVATWLYSQPDNTSCAGRRGLRCDKTADQPPLLPFSSAIALAPHPQPFRPAPITVPPMLSQLGRRTPGGSPYSSPTSPAPEYRTISTTHVYSPHHSPTRSLSMPSIVLSPPSPADGFANAHHAPSIHHFTAPPTPEG